MLLDDVLSAVDSHTGQHLVRQCFQGPLMQNRTCILVTHSIDLCLPAAAFVVSMDNGIVTYSGTPNQLYRSSSLPFVNPLIYAKNREFDEKAPVSLGIAMSPFPTDETTGLPVDTMDASGKARIKLVKEEEKNEGAVSAQVYLLYFRAMGGSWMVVASLVVFFATQLSEIG